MSFIALISILELYFLYKINVAYKGVYGIGIFIIFIVAQPFIFRILIKGKTNSKFKTLTTILIYILIPIIIYFTLPNYTYSDGRDIVEQSLKGDERFTIIDSSSGEYTVPVINNTQQIFIRDREYYYIIQFNNKNKYFIVNPLTGKLKEMEERYW